MISKVPDDSEFLRHLKSTFDFELYDLEFQKVAVDQAESQVIVLLTANGKNIGIDLTKPANSVVLTALINLNPMVFKNMLAVYANDGKILDKDIYEYALSVADGKEKAEITKYWNYYNQSLDSQA